MRRTPIVGGNWKMNTTLAEANTLARAVVDGTDRSAESCEIVLFPPFPYVRQVGEIVRDSALALGVQDAYPEASGAYTGEVGIEMLRDLCVSHVLVGHSERRHVIGESEGLIHRKLRGLLDADFHIVLCIGETLDQRETGETASVVIGQLASALDGVSSEQLDRLVIAYEPVWAIGTGRTATPDDAQTVHRALRQWLGERYTERVGSSIRIQYGGSVKPDNAAALFAQPDVDGFLVGGASLKSSDFLAIAGAAREE